MDIIKITSPQAVGSVKLKVTGRPKLILVNGHWNRLLHSFNMSPGEAGKNIGVISLPIEDHLMILLMQPKSTLKIKNIKMNRTMLTELPFLVVIRAEMIEK